MEISKATRTHLIYQFIILTLLFLSIGYNELLPDRKFILFLAFLPIFCYQLIILSCCMELIPVPSWMSFLQSSDKISDSRENFEKDFEPISSPVKKKISRTQTKELTFPEVPGMMPYTRRWEKSVTNLGATPKCFVPPQKSKSWVNLSDSRSSERLSSVEGSLDTLASLTEIKRSPKKIRNDKIRNRQERAVKAKSWKAGATNYDISERTFRIPKPTFAVKECTELPSSGDVDELKEESELEKSYSFPFRQKRLQTWLEMKESAVGPLNQSPDMPYWQTVGYNLAVKYEARRRRRAISQSAKTDVPNEELSNFRKSLESMTVAASAEKSHNKKSSKSAAACMNKIKAGFTNLISKKKEELNDFNVNSNKVTKPTLFKLKNRSTSSQAKEKEPVPELPQFLSNDRPVIFYPKYIPFEKERFEGDVKKKMIELAEEQKSNATQLI